MSADFSNRIEVWERWQTIDGVVYYEWKLASEENWHRKETALKNHPVHHLKYFSPEEWNIKEQKLLESSNRPCFNRDVEGK